MDDVQGKGRRCLQRALQRRCAIELKHRASVAKRCPPEGCSTGECTVATHHRMPAQVTGVTGEVAGNPVDARGADAQVVVTRWRALRQYQQIAGQARLVAPRLVPSGGRFIEEDFHAASPVLRSCLTPKAQWLAFAAVDHDTTAGRTGAACGFGATGLLPMTRSDKPADLRTKSSGPSQSKLRYTAAR